jgi:hypothetical protein
MDSSSMFATMAADLYQHIRNMILAKGVHMTHAAAGHSYGSYTIP